MGGNSLKQYDTTRLGINEYNELNKFIHIKLQEMFGHPGYDIPYYHSKDTFGDMDLVIDSSTLPNHWVDVVVKDLALLPTQWVKNGNVLSIGIKNFQIDLIITPSEDVESSIRYFSYNDLSNLLGRQHHKLGVKLGHRGLSIIIRGGNNASYVLDDILLTSDYGIALDIIGLSMNEYLQGFDTLEDMYNFVCKSKFFDPDIYLLDNRSHTSRIRDRKRASYNGFLTYIREHNIPATYTFDVKTEHGGYNVREPYYSEIIVPKFPWIEKKVNTLKEKFELAQQFKTLYNGSIVSSLTGLSGKALGAVMSKIKFSEEDMIYHLSHPNEFIGFLKKTYLTPISTR